MTYEQIVIALRQLDFTLTDEIVERVTEAHRGCYAEEEDPEFASDLLWAIGMGRFDDSWREWTPSSSEVYTFAAEPFRTENMYAVFLKGVAAIVPGLALENVQETLKDYTPIDPDEEGDELESQGTKTVSFTVRGHAYYKELDYYGEWFNDEIIPWVNDVLAQECFVGSLWGFNDATPGIVLVYGSREKAKALAKLLEPIDQELLSDTESDDANCLETDDDEAGEKRTGKKHAWDRSVQVKIRRNPPLRRMDCEGDGL